MIYDKRNTEGRETFGPSPEERTLMNEVYNYLQDDYLLKEKGQPMLGGRTLMKFWDQSEYDYNALCEVKDPTDPVVPYSSGISRDKSNVFITNLALNLFIPTVVAQNSSQEIDKTFSKVARAVLEYGYENDGRPAESGHQKFVRSVHKQVIQGTVHVQDDIVDNKLLSTLIPNEEVFIPNFYQPNLQLQGHLIRFQRLTTYAEAEAEFGGLENFKKYVYPGMVSLFDSREEPRFAKINELLDVKDKCTIMRCWKPVPAHKLAEYKEKGILPTYVKKAKYFNIFIGGVPMFPVENLMPYHDGNYPMNKGIFEMFSRPEYYWGNSLPNKIIHDKKWKDGWKTLLRWKGKLSAIPPLVSYNGTFVDSDIAIPGMITQAPAGMTKDDLQAVPGINAGITNSDVALEAAADNEIDRATSSAQQGGQVEKGRQTAREVVLAESNAKKILNGFAMQIMFFTSARSFPIIMRQFQFLTRNQIDKIAIPNQSLPDGSSGTMEVIFTDDRELTAGEVKDKEYEMYAEARKSSKEGNAKFPIEINRNYWQEIDLYLKATVESMLPDSPEIRQAKADMKFDKYASRPDLFNAKAAAKNLVIANGDDEGEMLIDDDQAKREEAKLAGQPGAGSGSGQNPLVKSAEQGPNQSIANDGIQAPGI